MNTPEPTYGCDNCLDLGVVLTERHTPRVGYQALYAAPCPSCTYGRDLIDGEARRREQEAEKPTRAHRPPNRSLHDWRNLTSAEP